MFQGEMLPTEPRTCEQTSALLNRRPPAFHSAILPFVFVPGACVTVSPQGSAIRGIETPSPIGHFLSTLPAKLQPASKKTRQLIFRNSQCSSSFRLRYTAEGIRFPTNKEEWNPQTPSSIGLMGQGPGGGGWPTHPPPFYFKPKLFNQRSCPGQSNRGAAPWLFLLA